MEVSHMLNRTLHHAPERPGRHRGRTHVAAALLLVAGLGRAGAPALRAQQAMPAPVGAASGHQGMAGAPVGAPLAVQGVTVIDVRTGQLRAAQTVLIQGRRIPHPMAPAVRARGAQGQQSGRPV